MVSSLHFDGLYLAYMTRALVILISEMIQSIGFAKYYIVEYSHPHMFLLIF